jgi:glutaminyl-peptide cyclotransferase
MTRPIRLAGCLALVLLLLALAGVGAAAPPVHGFKVVASWPHDTGAFTQGLVFADGELYESTGGYGQSSLRRVELATGRVLQRRALPATLFGEGLTAWRGELVQLTWREGKVLRYERATFGSLGELALSGEGWGLTHDERAWIVSDGSATLRFLDAGTGAERRRVVVRDAGRPVTRLNELELVPVPDRATGGSGEGVRGEVWANIWHSDRLVRVDPADGRVLGYVDLTGLWPQRERPHREAVLNGIAYDADGERLLVTGKHWPRLYWIEVPGLLPAPAGDNSAKP